MRSPIIPVYQPELSGNVKASVNECIDSSWISGHGRYVNAFEEGVAARVGSQHAVTVCHGTVALHRANIKVTVGPDARIGSLRLASGCKLGAGAVLTKLYDVEGTVLTGVPARPRA